MGDFQPQCPKCNKAMERGHMPDAAHGQMLQSRWSRGDPVERKFIGGIKWEMKNQILVTAWRCPACGYLEQYARLD